MDASTGFPPEFDERWSAVVMDDVQLYTPMQQARAFNWFVNAINPPSGSPCWILSAGDAPPAAMEVRDDLRSRLGWGHVFQLQVPNEEERREVLKTEAAARGVTLSADVVDYMLKRFSRDLAASCSCWTCWTSLRCATSVPSPFHSLKPCWRPNDRAAVCGPGFPALTT